LRFCFCFCFCVACVSCVCILLTFCVGRARYVRWKPGFTHKERDIACVCFFSFTFCLWKSICSSQGRIQVLGLEGQSLAPTAQEYRPRRRMAPRVYGVGYGDGVSPSHRGSGLGRSRAQKSFILGLEMRILVRSSAQLCFCAVIRPGSV